MNVCPMIAAAEHDTQPVTMTAYHNDYFVDAQSFSGFLQALGG